MAKPIRVRFCPSPTGNPHVGLVRTALFNWAFARHHGGTLVFRIEDTDAARDSEESYEALLDSMRWLGLDWDEGPEVGGPHAPYRQSQRMDFYRDTAAKLLDGGYAYHCYCTAEELETRRAAARAAGGPSGYDGHCRTLTAEQKAAYEAEGRTFIVRFRMPDEPITFTDLIRGELTFTPENVPDYGIVRANGAPLYTLVNPVDDALMEITHVLRGEDLLSSTPRQVALYKALIELGIAKDIPAFGHLPYVMGEGNKKLSKRDPQASLNLYRERGFIREGLLNYLSLLGWSLAADRDVFSMEEMVAAFEITDVNANPARFDLKKAEAINADHIRLLDLKTFIEACGPWLKAPVRALVPRGLRRHRLRGARSAGPDPGAGPLRHHRQRRLPLPRRAGGGRGVLDQGDEGRPDRAAHQRPGQALRARRRRLERRIPQGRRARRRRGAGPQARQGPGPGPGRRHRPYGRSASLRVSRTPRPRAHLGPYRRGPGETGRVEKPTSLNDGPCHDAGRQEHPVGPRHDRSAPGAEPMNTARPVLRPAAFLACCDALSLSPAEVAHVGNEPDIDAPGAVAAGVAGGRLDRGGSAGVPTSSRITDLAQLPRLLCADTRFGAVSGIG